METPNSTSYSWGAPNLIWILVAVAAVATGATWWNARSQWSKRELVVNYHFHRLCNYACKFCFHTAKTPDIASLEDAQKAMRALKQCGMSRVNFSGGEPFLKPSWLGKMCRFCHETLKLQVSIVSNGSKIRKQWLDKYGAYVDVLAISCDSFEPETLKAIGRYENKSDHIQQLRSIAQWCKEYRIVFKINTVVCSPNKHETMVEQIQELNPKRWKVFQCLLIDGENAGAQALRDARGQVVSTKDFNAFVERHREVETLVAEDNATMRNS